MRRFLPELTCLEERCLLSDGGFTQIPLPTRGPAALTVGPDGNMWYANSVADLIGRVSPSGTITEFPITTGSFAPQNLSIGPDGNLWFTEVGYSGPDFSHLARISLDGTITQFPNRNIVHEALGRQTNSLLGYLPFLDGSSLVGVNDSGTISEFPFPSSIPDVVPDAAGNVWASSGHFISQMSSSGAFSTFSLGDPNRFLTSLVKGGDGNVWFVDYLLDSSSDNSRTAPEIGRITPTGTITEFDVAANQPRDAVDISALHSGPDGSLWFLEASNGSGSFPSYGGPDLVGRIMPNGEITKYALPGGLGVIVNGVVPGPDSNLWFDGLLKTSRGADQISRLPISSLSTGMVSVITATQGVTFSSVVADVRVPDPANTLATVSWGGGDAVPATLHADGQGGFTVMSAGKFRIAGTFPVTVTLTDGNGVQTLLQATAQVEVGPTQHFVAQLYHDMLGRDAESTGMDFWLRQLQANGSAETIVQGFENSAEYQSKTIESLYRTLLGRPSDQAGHDFFLTALQHGETFAEVKQALLASPEYLQRAGGTPAGFVASLYREALGRTADLLGLVFWTNQLVVTSAATVVKLFLGSAEAKQALVQSDFMQWLHRPADAAGLEAFQQSLAHGASEVDLIAALLASPEYAQHASA
jgi:virginiamycin B lyase